MGKTKARAIVKKENVDDADSPKNEQIATSSSSSAIPRVNTAKKGPLPTKKFSGPLPPEEEIKLPQPKQKAAPKAKAAAKTKVKTEAHSPKPETGSRRNSLAARELAGLMTEQSTPTEGKRSRDMSTAALLKLAAELDEQEMREMHRRKKELDQEIRAARVADSSPLPSPVSRSAPASRAAPPAAAAPKKATKADKQSKAPARAPASPATKRAPARPLTTSPPKAPAPKSPAKALAKPLARMSARPILRDEKSTPTNRKLSVTFGGGEEREEKSQLEMDDAPAPKGAKGKAKGAAASSKGAAKKSAPSTSSSSSSSSSAATTQKRTAKDSKAADAPAGKKQKTSAVVVAVEEGEMSMMNKSRREAMRDSQQIVDECPSCRVPLITNPILKTIDIDTYEDRDVAKVALPHVNRKMCVAKNGEITNELTSDGDGSDRRIDVWSAIKRRLVDKFDGKEIPDDYYIPGTKNIALRNQYLTPDILMAVSDFQRATADLPKHCKLLVCAYPTWAKDVYYRLRFAYEKQVQIMIAETGGPSTSAAASSSLSVDRPTRIRCHCDKYNLQRCGDKKSACCKPEMLELEARAYFDEE